MAGAFLVSCLDGLLDAAPPGAVRRVGAEQI